MRMLDEVCHALRQVLENLNADFMGYDLARPLQFIAEVGVNQKR